MSTVLKIFFADFATIVSKSFVHSSCLSWAQKVFCWIISFHERYNKKCYIFRVGVEKQGKQNDEENKKNTLRWGKEQKYWEKTLSWKKTKKTNYIGEITKKEDNGNLILYFSEIIISMLNIALK